ncbi:MAG: phosphoribosylanthranilate isomerase [Marinoscillum sp.]|jgi:phosphoribosylanthranilate isomerase
MALKTFVKISNVDNLSDARYCAGMMVDVIGFNLNEKTEGYISAETFGEITDWVAGVKFCGEFGDADVASIKLASANYKLNFIETSQLDLLEELSELGIPLIYRAIIDANRDLNTIEKNIDYAKEITSYVIVDFGNQITSALSFNENNLADANMIISLKADSNNLDAMITEGTYSGIELMGTPEDRPGFKDYDYVMDTLEALEILD